MATEQQIKRLRGGLSRSIADVVSPPDKQVQFLRTILTEDQERKKFLDDPKGYALRKKVFLDPAVVSLVSKNIQFEPIITSEIKKLGPSAVAEIERIRATVDVTNPFRVAAVPAAVAAGAAVVAAVVAVATLVVTLVRVSKIDQIGRPTDMTRLKLLKEMGRTTRI